MCALTLISIYPVVDIPSDFHELPDVSLVLLPDTSDFPGESISTSYLLVRARVHADLGSNRRRTIFISLPMIAAVYSGRSPRMLGMALDVSRNDGNVCLVTFAVIVAFQWLSSAQVG